MSSKGSQILFNLGGQTATAPDPEYSATALRIKEVDWHEENGNDDLEDLFNKAQKKYNAVKKCLIKKEKSPKKHRNLELKLYKYKFLPKIWLMIIDDTNYLFSWYPNNRRIQKNVTFHLSSEIGKDVERIVIDSLGDYANSIEENSIQDEL